jgi:21S rRNA (GM2251-2'-O)-methyltransferase
MSAAALSKGAYRLGTRSRWTNLPYASFQQLRAASLNTAIGRGLRRSKGVGFRGREKFRERKDSDDDYAAATGRVGRGLGSLVRRTADVSKPGQVTRNSRRGDDKLDTSGPRIRRGKKDIKDPNEPLPRRSRAARFYDPNHSFGKKSQEKRRAFEVTGARRDGGNLRPKPSAAAMRAAESDRVAFQRNPDGSKLSKSRLAYLAKMSADSKRNREDDSPVHPSSKSKLMDNIALSAGGGFRSASASFKSSREDRRASIAGDSPQSTWTGKQLRSEKKGEDGGSAERPPFTQSIDRRLPVSIPYTTAASEFLYGTSVVEAALRSNRNPRRKLYKMYIYAGENRETAQKDQEIKRLAKKNGVEIVNADANGLRVMDKMSGGRPHNGYILEASPLPKLPVTSLGEITSQDGRAGFNVVLGHQSAEEAAVNGTDNFIPLTRDAPPSRKPLVLFLDSILDPGNLGGIIRTASFLGVTAVALATRNSTTFTPVVLKASAGASENIALFAVKSPAAFIADSKLAGWKVYAAVAPTRPANSHAQHISTDDLDAPLDHHPTILMLGSEGDGLRWTLRSKADVELSIRGCAQAGSIDSLNVSVAAGILCSAFLHYGRARATAATLPERTGTQSRL